MKFLADEGFPKLLSVAIRKLDHSVTTVQQKRLIGSSDETVIETALKEKRIVLTFDKDFLKYEKEGLVSVVFYFPKTRTDGIISLLGMFLLELGKMKSSKKRIYKFSTGGLEVVK